MKIWFSSDTHYMHSNIIRYCARPFTDVDHMNREMVSRWNENIAKDDIAIHVGDVSAGVGQRRDELQHIISELNGTKLLIRGNHDHMNDSWYLNAGFNKVLPHVNLGGVFLTHYPLQNLILNGFDFSEIGDIEHVIHGHDHRTDIPEYDNHFNVAVDRHNFTPIEDDRAIPEKYLQQFRCALIDLLK